MAKPHDRQDHGCEDFPRFLRQSLLASMNLEEARSFLNEVCPQEAYDADKISAILEPHISKFAHAISRNLVRYVFKTKSTQ